MIGIKPFHLLLVMIIPFAYGTNVVASKLAVEYYPPLFACFIRYGFIALCLTPFVGRPQLSFKQLLILALTQGVGFVGMANIAVKYSSNMTLLLIVMQLTVPLTSIFASIFLKDHIGWRRSIGIVVAFLGVLFIFGAPGAEYNFISIFLISICVISCAIFNVYIKTIPAANPINMTVWSSVVTFPIFLLLAYIFEVPDFTLLLTTPIANTLALLYGACVPGVIAVGLWFYLLQKYSVHVVAPFTLLVPFFGAIASMLILGEQLTMSMIIGGIISLLGVAIVAIRKPEAISPTSR